MTKQLNEYRKKKCVYLAVSSHDTQNEIHLCSGLLKVP